MAKKIIRKKVASAKKGKATAKKISRKAMRAAKPAVRLLEALGVKKAGVGVEELVIEQAKFSHPQTHYAPTPRLSELPHQYDADRIILQVRDPWWLHAYWELKNATIERLKNGLKDLFYKAKRMLRVYDVSNIIFNGSNANRHFDIQVPELADNWYIDAGGPGRSWCVDFGLLLTDGRFITIVRSNVVQAPIEGPSWITDEEWMVPEEMFGRLYGIGFGLGRSSPGKAWRERVKRALFSGAMASPGMASMASPVKKVPRQRKFWLVVDCELIVYGATEPDAKLTVQDKEIKLRPDGTFTLRFALPDGKQVIPVKAISADLIEERTITPIVNRETKVSQPIFRNV